MGKIAGHFNGHTWIVIIIAISALVIVGIAEIVVGYLIITNTTNDSSKTMTEICLATVPLQVVYGIVKIVDRITYIPKEGENEKPVNET